MSEQFNNLGKSQYRKKIELKGWGFFLVPVCVICLVIGIFSLLLSPNLFAPGNIRLNKDDQFQVLSYSTTFGHQSPNTTTTIVPKTRSLTGYDSQNLKNESSCCRFPDGCSLFCPIYSPNYKQKDCSRYNKVVCLKGKHKSGTTWMEYLVSGILETVCSLNPDECTYEYKPVPGIPNKAASYTIFVKGQLWLTVTAYDDEVWGCFKHKHPDEQFGNLLILRDPRDVIVSRHFYTNQPGNKVSTHYALSELKQLNKWHKVVVSSATTFRKEKKGGLQIVRYEELNKESPIVMKQIYDFLSLDCFAEFSEEVSEIVFDKYAFSKLTKEEETKGGVIGSQRTGRTKKMREGKFFQFAKYFKPKDLDLLEKKLRGNPEFQAINLPYYEKEQLGT